MLGAVGAYDWSGTVVQQTASGHLIFPKQAFEQILQDRNHSSYLGEGHAAGCPCGTCPCPGPWGVIPAWASRCSSCLPLSVRAPFLPIRPSP